MPEDRPEVENAAELKMQLVYSLPFGWIQFTSEGSVHNNYIRKKK